MFPNWSGWKTVKLLLSVVGGLVGTLATAGVLPENVASVIAAVDGTLLTLVVTLSGTAMGPSLVKS